MEGMPARAFHLFSGALLFVSTSACAVAPDLEELAGQRLTERSGMAVTAGLAEWQVIQRDAAGVGTIECVGTSERDGDVWARVLRHTRPVAGLEWRRVGAAEDGTFSATIPKIPTGGPYNVEFRVGAPDPDTYGTRVENVVVGDLWILAGQSNMHGCGRMRNAATPSPLVRAFAMNDRWEIASDPLHWRVESIDPVHRKTATELERDLAQRGVTPDVGAGLGLPFAKALSSAVEVPIGLIPCAQGATSMDQWDPALKDQGGRSLYGAMYRRFEAVGGKVRGVLWYQGESEARNNERASAYEGKLKRFIEAVRRDFGDPQLPFYMVQIARTIGTRSPERWMHVREVQRRVGRQIPGVTTVAAIDLELDDTIHIGTVGLKRLGKRLANVARHELFADPQVTCGPRVASVTPADSILYARVIKNGAVRVTFENVNDRLWPIRHIAGFSLRDKEGKPVTEFFDVRVDPDDPFSVLCLAGVPIPTDAMLWYGYGLNPYCNLRDEVDMAVLAFGPMAIEPKPTQP